MGKKRDKRNQPPPGHEFRHALSHDFSLAEQLLEKGSTLLDGIVYGSETALHYWSVENRLDIVEWLLQRKADPNKNSEHGRPLLEAASLGNVEVCKRLIEAGSDPHYISSTGERPLHAAAAHGYGEICEALIKAGAEVNAQEMCDETAWDQALPRKQAEIRQLLEKHGGKTGRPNDDEDFNW